MSTKEAALKKALEQKEEIRDRGEDLQQLMEDAVKKAIFDSVSEEGGGQQSSDLGHNDFHSNPQVQLEDSPLKETGGSLSWQSGINAIAVNIKIKAGKKGGVLFVSSVPGEGTTTICAHVGQALAKVNPGRVLLMDCNAQKPGIHKIFKTEAVPGLMEILQGKTSWAEAVRKSPIPNFFILPFGQKIPDPLLILGSSGMEDLLKTLKENFDFILMDVPPILTSVEAEWFAPRVESLILVIKAQATRQEVVLRAVERMTPYKEFMGAILNQQEFTLPKFLYRKPK